MSAPSAASQDVLKLRRDAELLSAGLPPLPLALDRIATNISPGAHGRKRRGPGESFWQFRRYEWGDDIRAIDWRRSARGHRVYIREQEWEAAQTVWMWRDSSPSMDFSSLRSGETKRTRASVLLLALANLLLRGGENVALLDSGQRPAGGIHRLDQLAITLATKDLTTADSGTDPENFPDPRNLSRYSSLIIIGDFLTPLEDVSAMMRRLSSQAIRGHVVQILDPAEEDLPYDGRVRFADPETQDEYTVGAVEDLRQAYRDRMQARQHALRDHCRQVGWSYLRHRTDQPAQLALLALINQLSGPQTTKAAGSGGTLSEGLWS